MNIMPTVPFFDVLKRRLTGGAALKTVKHEAEVRVRYDTIIVHTVSVENGVVELQLSLTQDGVSIHRTESFRVTASSTLNFNGMDGSIPMKVSGPS